MLPLPDNGKYFKHKRGVLDVADIQVAMYCYKNSQFEDLWQLFCCSPQANCLQDTVFSIIILKHVPSVHHVTILRQNGNITIKR